MQQQALGRHDDQRLAQAAPVAAAPHLAPKQMEILGWRGAIGYLHIVVGAKLQITLQARAGMLRSPAFLPVREQEYDAAGLPPLRSRRRDKLVDHDLSA